ncbi:MAG: hypothetical protein ABSA74_00100 [Candidatus Staskawiczbacteria bacterium]
MALEIQYPTITIGGKTASIGTDFVSYVKYLFFLGMAIGFFSVFLSLLVAGVMYFVSPVDPGAELLSRAKDRISGAISGLLILAMIYLIITTLNPQLSILNMGTLQQLPPAPSAQQPPGVYFYKGTDCSDDPAPDGNVSSVPDLSDLDNKVHSVGIVQNPNSPGGYISIIYDTINYQGKCWYLNPTQSCQPAVDPQTGSPFANSASIFDYDPQPDGDGVYFYRKPCLNTQGVDISGLVSYCNTNGGGYYKASNSDIAGKYILELKTKQFTGSGDNDCTVPKEEQDCTKYQANGQCDKDSRVCPSLGGENISSVIINGNYVVLFVYKGPNDNSDDGPWTSCQVFPTSSDANQTGPQAIKWDVIRNRKGVLPNYVIIIPVQPEETTE